jgi:alpha/beta superfamily hydrolase
LALVGFSFGSFIAYRVSTLRCVSHLVTIAPPISRFDFARLPAPRVPWLVVQGDRDELVDYASVCSWAQSIAPAPEMATIADGEHFFHGKLNELKTVVQQFVTR